MTYPGNASLAGPVKDRVVSTFRQTLALYKQGRTDEVAAGCTLILQMDPQFDPAKKLLEKSRNPSLPIDIDSLLPAEGPAPLEQARQAMAARDFERVVRLTGEVLTNDMMNDEARILGDEAREKLEAAPFIAQFVRKSEQQLAAGNMTSARAELEKARALDDSHPEVLRASQAIAARQSGARPAASSSSFIVDDAQKATGRAAALASDFGFTFEEDKPAESSFGNFSFDTPSSDSPFGAFSFGTPAETPAAPPKPPAGDFDFSTASVSTSPDDQKKIDQYLADGDRAASAGEYQQAIDLWSRIFLIDVTNEQASERIERAKAKRHEIEEKVDTLIASGNAALERRDTSRARADFTEALRLDPNNASAQEAMQRVAAPEGQDAAAETPFVPPPLEDDKIDIGFFDEELPPGAEGPLIPPPPGAAAAAATKKSGPMAKPKIAKPARKLPVGALLAVLGLLLLAAGGWYAWSRFMKEPAADPAATEAIFARAKVLAARGKIEEAIAVLGNIKPTDPQHDRALVMMADLRKKKTQASQLIDGKPEGQYYDEKLAAARAAFGSHDYAAAKAAFEDAQRVKPLPPDAKQQYDTAADQVAKLDAAKSLFTEGKYGEALSNLQTLAQQDPQNQNIQRLIVDAHFNVGAKALQEGRTADAVRAFDEVLKVTPNDELARRSRELATRYDNRNKDLLYQIYVKYLPLRQAT